MTAAARTYHQPWSLKRTSRLSMKAIRRAMRKRLSRSQRAGAAVVEEPIDGGSGAADVGAKGPACEKLVDERRPSGRGREVARRKRGKIPRTAHGIERLEEGRPLLLEILPAPRLVEAAVDVARRAFARQPRNRDQRPVVLRQLERTEPLSCAFRELRARGEKEGNVGADRGREPRKLVAPERI